jgi:signal peptide peptidase SppA
MRAFQFAANQLWAIEESYLRIILNIAQRADTADLEAVAQRQADRASKDGLLQQFGTVGVINIVGPIFRYANLFTQISGATSVEALAKTIGAAADNPDIQSVILNLDSPGGEVSGISELSKAIAKMNASKPVVAYVDDMGASGAYWLAVAARSIVASDTAKVGSIGIIATVIEGPEDAAEKKYRFVSSISPKKRPDLETDEGRASIQTIVDDLGAVFAKAVAAGRGVSAEEVVSNFGQGGLLVAGRGLEVGMIDEIGTFEGLKDRMKSGSIPRRTVSHQKGASAMPAISVHHTATTDVPYDGATMERNLKLGGTEAYYRSAHSWQDPDKDPTLKGSYKGKHHMVAEDGTIGAANTRACSAVIGELNGGRGGFDVPAGDRPGIHAHVGAHLKDGEKEVPPLKGIVASATNLQGEVQGETMQKPEVADTLKPPEAPATPPVAKAAPPELLVGLAGGALAPFEQARQILQLCALAGLTARQALVFLKPEASIDAVRQELIEVRAANSGPEINSHILPEAGAVGEKTKPKDSPIEKACEAHAEQLAQARKER